MQHWKLVWQYGSASIRSSAAMLWDCEFRTVSGRRFVPFARAPWADDPTLDPELPAHIRHLGGEFVCVPFGTGGRPEQLLKSWASDSWDQVNVPPHGLSSNAIWELVSADADAVCLRLPYPVDDDIDYLTRTVRVVPDAPALDLELLVHVRRATRQPLGLHPILRLPEQIDQLRIEAFFKFGLTYPAFTPPGVSRVVPGQRFARLDAVSGIRGGMVDYSRLPKATPTEEMLMLCGVRAPITVRYIAEKIRFRLTWDTALLPSCLLWPSDGAIADPPWNRRFRGLGIEPIAALFDAARDVAREPNPLNAAGIATSVEITPERPLAIRYRIEVADDPEIELATADTKLEGLKR